MSANEEGVNVGLTSSRVGRQHRYPLIGGRMIMQARIWAIALLGPIVAGCASTALRADWPDAPVARSVPAALALDQPLVPMVGPVETGTVAEPPSGRICQQQSRRAIGQPPAAATITTHCANVTFSITPDGWQRARLAIFEGPASGLAITIDRAPDGSILIPETLPAAADRTPAGRAAQTFRGEMAAVLRASRQFRLEQGQVLQTGNEDGCGGAHAPRCSDLFPQTSLTFTIPRRTSCRTVGASRASGRDVIVLACAIAGPMGLDAGVSWLALDRATGLRLREIGVWRLETEDAQRTTAMRFD